MSAFLLVAAAQRADLDLHPARRMSSFSIRSRTNAARAADGEDRTLEAARLAMVMFSLRGGWEEDQCLSILGDVGDPVAGGRAGPGDPNRLPEDLVPPAVGRTPMIDSATSVRPAPTRPARPTISPWRTANETSSNTPSQESARARAPPRRTCALAGVVREPPADHARHQPVLIDLGNGPHRCGCRPAAP